MATDTGGYITVVLPVLFSFGYSILVARCFDSVFGCEMADERMTMKLGRIY